MARVIYDLLNESDKEKYDKLCKQAVDDCDEFKEFLLDDDWSSVQLAFDGLQYGIKVRITSDERAKLQGAVINRQLDKLDVLGLYCRARSAELSSQIIELSNRANFKDS